MESKNIFCKICKNYYLKSNKYLHIKTKKHLNNIIIKNIMINNVIKRETSD
jgi:hypothetical protein